MGKDKVSIPVDLKRYICILTQNIISNLPFFISFPPISEILITH